MVQIIVVVTIVLTIMIGTTIIIRMRIIIILMVSIIFVIMILFILYWYFCQCFQDNHNYQDQNCTILPYSSSTIVLIVGKLIAAVYTMFKFDGRSVESRIGLCSWFKGTIYCLYNAYIIIRRPDASIS